jgi:hypothetical protein
MEKGGRCTSRAGRLGYWEEGGSGHDEDREKEPANDGGEVGSSGCPGGG